MIILITGVSGSGKTTISKLLAESLHWEFSDADAFHPPENIAKMKQGIPLDDGDRQPWLDKMATAIASWLQDDRNMVLACSALKESYRQLLVKDPQEVSLVYLHGSMELIQKRLQERPHHYMPPSLLQSQFDALEEPADAVWVEISDPQAVIVQKIRDSLKI
jgi:gluconokinase